LPRRSPARRGAHRPLPSRWGDSSRSAGGRRRIILRLGFMYTELLTTLEGEGIVGARRLGDVVPEPPRLGHWGGSGSLSSPGEVSAPRRSFRGGKRDAAASPGPLEADGRLIN